MLKIIIFILGLIIGSFLNVLIYRLPRGQDIIKKRSYCPKCKKILSWYELIPVLSFIIQRGRCLKCKAKISYQYIFIELLTGLLFLFTYINLTNQFATSSSSISSQILSSNFQTLYFALNIIYYFYIISIFITIAAIDLKTFFIPDVLVILAIIISFIYQIIQLPNYPITQFFNLLISSIAIFFFFGALHFFSKGKAMGFGDAKLGLLIGLFLPFPLNIFAIMLSFIIGGIFGIILMIFKKVDKKSIIPFGPFMVLGALLTFFLPQLIKNIFPLF
jgi:leader peptidase (prepilin peptidase)/N-methyltransferase